MDWLQVSIYTTSAGIEPVCGRLYQVGVNGIEIEDEKDFKSFLEENTQLWDYVDEDLMRQKESETCVKIYISDDPDGREMLMAVRDTISRLRELDKDGEFGRLEISLGNIAEKDWANNWKKYFHPVEIGERILIKPEWEELDASTDRVVFNINPGMTFGTGSHHTTQLCIEEIEKYVTGGESVIDLGCGSGILSVISLMLGAKSAVAVDIDPNSVEVAYANAERNGVDKSAYRVILGDVIADEKLKNELMSERYDVVVANIVADVIILLTPIVKKLMKADGVFISSGIIEDRREDVLGALLENGFSIAEEKHKADWIEFTCRL